MLRSRQVFVVVTRQAAAIATSHAKADAQLRASERRCAIEDSAVARVDVAQLPANRPIEDYLSFARCLSSNALVCGVFDGHAGPSCSRHVSTRLMDYVCAAVLEKHVVADIALQRRTEWIFSSADPHLPLDFKDAHEKHVQAFHKKIRSDSSVTTVRKALEAAFCTLDEDISRDAMPDSLGKVSKAHADVATSGSCAVVAHIREGNLHVANVGDSAAVLGVATHGGISARVLSKAHCVDNTDEVKRIRSGHPMSEAATVLRGGRLLGELFPLRAFGDVRYKWPRELQKTALEPIGAHTPVALVSPPYLTATPEVLYHKLTSNDRFLVLASDGLWEWLEPDTVVRLVSDHAFGAQTLTPYVPPKNATLLQVCMDLQQRLIGKGKKPLDENSATHVLRHALGGCTGGTDTQYRRLADMLELPASVARNYRDDITIIVVHFNQNYIASLGNTDQ